MEIWERKAAKAVNVARSLCRDEQTRLYQFEEPGKGRDARQDELEAIQDLLTEVKAHIDPHRVVDWEYQTPLPF